MMKQEAWEMVQAPVHGPGPDCGPECAVCGWGDGQDGYGLPHSLHTCVHILKGEAYRAQDAAAKSFAIATAAREYVAAVEEYHPVRLIDLEENKAGKAWRKLIATVVKP